MKVKLPRATFEISIPGPNAVIKRVAKKYAYRTLHGLQEFLSVRVMRMDRSIRCPKNRIAVFTECRGHYEYRVKDIACRDRNEVGKQRRATWTLQI
jgi:hypothetical protein